MRSALVWIFAGTALLVPLLTADAQTYHDELQQGIEAYKSNHYEQAIDHFRRATQIDPDQPTAHLYLATAYLSQYIPGIDSPDNLEVAELAIKEYERVLASDSTVESKLNSAKGIAYVYLNMKKFEEAKFYYEKASGFKPDDPEPYYSLGVIDWTSCYVPRMTARAKLGIKPDEHLDGSIPRQERVCADLKVKNLALIEDGIANLNRAIELRPDYDDAMAYMNLMYRERADLECDDPTARARDLKTADHWVDKTLAVKKGKAREEKINRQMAPTAPNPQ